MRPATPSLNGLAVAILVADLLFPSLMVSLLTSLNQPVKVWPNALYVAILFVQVFCTVAIS